MERNRGYINQVVKQRGYGFITTDKEVNLFFHASGLIGFKFEDLKEGFEVSYIEIDTPKGPKAIGVTVEKSEFYEFLEKNGCAKKIFHS